MYLLFETIKIINGEPVNLDFHQERFDKSRYELFGIPKSLFLSEVISVPREYASGMVKCRIIYEKHIRQVQYDFYKPRRIRRLRLVECNNIDYRYKYADRSLLNLLFQQKKNCDEILIVKNGLITDTSFSNIIFDDGEKWVTPNEPLLKGTQREYLLKKGIITGEEIKADEIFHFLGFKIINAMLTFYDSDYLKIENIVF